MTPNMPFNNTPFMVGFDELEEMLSRISKTAEGFPPYNVEQLENGLLRITLAVAGYNESDLQITQEENQLIIKGHQENNTQRHFLHRGIAGRNFLKSFILAEGMKIIEASLENGLLNIDLEKPIRRINIQKIDIKVSKRQCLSVQPKRGATHGKT